MVEGFDGIAGASGTEIKPSFACYNKFLLINLTNYCPHCLFFPGKALRGNFGASEQYTAQNRNTGQIISGKQHFVPREIWTNTPFKNSASPHSPPLPLYDEPKKC